MAVLEHPALNDFDQSRVWEGLIGAQTRAQYFGNLVQVLRKRQRYLTTGSLILSSGAAIALLTASFPAYGWAKGLLALASAILSAISLVSSNEKNAIEASDLSYRWSNLAIAYENLWANLYEEAASEVLRGLQDEEAKVSKSSTALPNDVKLMTEAEDNIAMHYAGRLTA